MKAVGRLPPLAVIVGRYLGYKIDEPATEASAEDHAASLVAKLTGLG